MNINAKDIFIKEKKKEKYFIHGAKKTLYLSIIKFIYNYNYFRAPILVSAIKEIYNNELLEKVVKSNKILL